jgi:hypothetical protein
MMNPPERTPEEILEYSLNRSPEDIAQDVNKGLEMVGRERFAAMQMALYDAMGNGCPCSVCYAIRSIYESAANDPEVGYE